MLGGVEQSWLAIEVALRTADVGSIIDR